jgi:hypothetical protein
MARALCAPACRHCRRRCHPQCERKRYGGWLPPTGVSSPSAAAAIKLAETSEFHWQLALEGQALGGEEQAGEEVCGSGRKCWRWRGTLTGGWAGRWRRRQHALVVA